MFFKSNVLPEMLKEHVMIETFESGASTIYPAFSEYFLNRVIFSTVGPGGSIVYGYTICEEHRALKVARWLRIDYNTLTVHHQYNSGYEATEIVSNCSVLNNEKLIAMGFSKHELQLLSTLVQHVKYRGSNVLQN